MRTHKKNVVFFLFQISCVNGILNPFNQYSCIKTIQCIDFALFCIKIKYLPKDNSGHFSHSPHSIDSMSNKKTKRNFTNYNVHDLIHTICYYNEYRVNKIKHFFVYMISVFLSLLKCHYISEHEFVECSFFLSLLFHVKIPTDLFDLQIVWIY